MVVHSYFMCQLEYMYPLNKKLRNFFSDQRKNISISQLDKQSVHRVCPSSYCQPRAIWSLFRLRPRGLCTLLLLKGESWEVLSIIILSNRFWKTRRQGAARYVLCFRIAQDMNIFQSTYDSNGRTGNFFEGRNE